MSASLWKILKDLCTVKRKKSIKKNAYLSSEVNAIIRNNLLQKFKYPSTPTISCVIGKRKINNVLLDLGSSINLLPYTVYQ